MKHANRTTFVEVPYMGRAIAQAVSNRLPTGASRVRAQVRSCGICGGQSGTVVGFPGALPFPLPIIIPPTAHYHLSSRTRTIGQLVAEVPSGLSHPTQNSKKKYVTLTRR
jgi:hypothetical protein